MKKRTDYKVSGGNVFKDLDVPTDRLLRFITSLGQDVDIVIRARRSTKGRGHLHVVAA